MKSKSSKLGPLKMHRRNKEKWQNAKLPQTGVLIGQDAIGEVFGVGPKTIANWRRVHGLRLSRLPDGRTWATTAFEIDRWLMSRKEGREDAMQRARDALKLLSRQQRLTLLEEMTRLRDPNLTQSEIAPPGSP